VLRRTTRIAPIPSAASNMDITGLIDAVAFATTCALVWLLCAGWTPGEICSAAKPIPEVNSEVIATRPVVVAVNF
jgi:hypothetical protein